MFGKIRFLVILTTEVVTMNLKKQPHSSIFLVFLGMALAISTFFKQALTEMRRRFLNRSFSPLWCTALSAQGNPPFLPIWEEGGYL